jgi:hypothetical protein
VTRQVSVACVQSKVAGPEHQPGDALDGGNLVRVVGAQFRLDLQNDGSAVPDVEDAGLALDEAVCMPRQQLQTRAWDRKV